MGRRAGRAQRVADEAMGSATPDAVKFASSVRSGRGPVSASVGKTTGGIVPRKPQRTVLPMDTHRSRQKAWRAEVWLGVCQYSINRCCSTGQGGAICDRPGALAWTSMRGKVATDGVPRIRFSALSQLLTCKVQPIADGGLVHIQHPGRAAERCRRVDRQQKLQMGAIQIQVIKFFRVYIQPARFPDR